MKKEKNHHNMVKKKQKRLEKVGLDTKQDRGEKEKTSEKKKELSIKNKKNKKTKLLLHYQNLKKMEKQRIAE